MLCFYISFGFSNLKKANERVREDDRRGRLHSQDYQGIFIILFLWRQHSCREVFSLNLSRNWRLGSDGEDTL